MKSGRLLSNPRKRGGLSDRHQPISKASTEQREKVAEFGRCIACPNLAPFTPIDPAHLAARGFRGGCNDALCVVALCRWCHRALDDRKLDGGLLGHLLAQGMVAEIQHAVGHYDGDLCALVERLECQRCVVVTYERAAELGL